MTPGNTSLSPHIPHIPGHWIQSLPAVPRQGPPHSGSGHNVPEPEPLAWRYAPSAQEDSRSVWVLLTQGSAESVFFLLSSSALRTSPTHPDLRLKAPRCAGHSPALLHSHKLFSLTENKSSLALAQQLSWLEHRPDPSRLQF